MRVCDITVDDETVSESIDRDIRRTQVELYYKATFFPTLQVKLSVTYRSRGSIDTSRVFLAELLSFSRNAFVSIFTSSPPAPMLNYLLRNSEAIIEKR